MSVVLARRIELLGLVKEIVVVVRLSSQSLLS